MARARREISRRKRFIIVGLEGLEGFRGFRGV